MEKLNIAELLKDCPKGMELDCTTWENVTFEKVVNDLIYVKRNNKDAPFFDKIIVLNKYGCCTDHKDEKCRIFPKDKNTWEGFVPPCQFKDGDVVYIKTKGVNHNEFIIIFKEIKNDHIHKHACFAYQVLYTNKNAVCHLVDVEIMRLATEEEKAKLFKVIKDNGYHWNDETTTLEKLVESKEDTDVKIVMSGIYFDREYFADEVELQLGNYKIEVRDGKTYAVFKNQETKISKPKFKVGDKIKHKDTVLTIINLQTNSYIVEDEPDNFGILMFSQQDKWELINEPKFKVGDKIKCKGLDVVNPIEISEVTPRIYTFTNGSFQYIEIVDKDYELISRKFDVSILKPYDKVLVRDTKEQVWVADLFSHMVKRPLGGYTFACVGHYPSQCIPYEGNEHLLGTTDDCDEYFNLIS